MTRLDDLVGRRVYLDANVFIYFLDGTPRLRESAAALLRAARDGHFSAITSHAAVAEVMAGPYQSGDPLMIRNTREFFQQPRLVTLVEHTAKAFEDAAMLRGTLGMPFIDALHVATAASAGCEVIVTHDARMRSALGVDVIPMT